jgi:hypothetical protein
MYMQDVAAQDSSAAAGGGAAGSGSVGRFRALVDTIIGNLELKISNIHIRYEDSSSNPGHTFCIGVLLSEISAHTVGEDWQRKFVTADALLTLRKVGMALCGSKSGGSAAHALCPALQQQETPTSGVWAGPLQCNRHGAAHSPGTSAMHCAAGTVPCSLTCFK